MKTRVLLLSVILLVLATLALLTGCSGSKSTTTSNMGTVNLTVSDPPTCAGPSGPFSHVYVTIRDVKIHQSANAGANDSGWVDLTPDLASAPKQVDLLGLANNQCFLATLGSQVELQAGSYQQIRVFLSDSSDFNKISGNLCAGHDVNCVILSSDSSEHTLNLSSESQTGIKIPSGQLAGGNFTIGAGEAKDLNIDFDACASIIAAAGGYHLKPVLHAGEVHLTSVSVSGKLVDSVSNTAIIGGKAIVALEQKDASGTDRVIMQTTPDANGNFALCPVPAGTYDVVAVAVNGTGVAYAATIVSAVQPGSALGNVPMVAQTGANLADASISGMVTTTSGLAGTPDDITLYAMQQVTINSSSVNVIIPLAQQSSSTASLTTVADGSCSANTYCAAYTLAVPAMWPNMGTFSAGGTTYTQSTATPVGYSVGAQAFSGGVSTCLSPEVVVNTLSGGGALTVTPGGGVTAATIAFNGC